MAHKNFTQLIKEEFDFLRKDYAFALIQCKKIRGGYTISFMNETTGVRINYEFREAYIFVTIHKLIHGKFVDNPRPIQPNSLITGFSLDDVVALRNPRAAVRPAFAYDTSSKFHDPINGLKLFVRKFATNLKKYASDMLKGNFQLFDQLETIVKQRASRECARIKKTVKQHMGSTLNT